MRSVVLCRRIVWYVLVISLMIASQGQAAVPQLISYQGRVSVEGTNFHGMGLFKFALVNSNATATFWSNDGTSTDGGAPTTNISLSVNRGLYSVLLGDATLANMTILPCTVFTNSDVRLRVWFNDGTHEFQRLTPDQRIAAVGYAMMSANAELADTVKDGAITAEKLAPGAVTEASVADGAISTAKLAANVTVGVPSGGIVLSENEADTNLLNAGYVRLMPMQQGNVWNVWHDTTPAGRYSHTAVWSGSEMIMWGGLGADGQLNTGGRYNPATDTWTPTTTSNAPTGRSHHTAVWSGSEMILWGGWYGSNVYLNTGGRYDPMADTWTSITLDNAPAARHDHTAVWSGNEMLIWGGTVTGTEYLNTGGRYNPTSNTWTSINSDSAPTARRDHTAVWSGSEMIIWGGVNSVHLNTGARYNPETDTWTPTIMDGAPSARNVHTAVWSGSEMIVWGGGNSSGRLNTGGRYNPETDTWTPTTTSGAPSARHLHQAVWSGHEMIVWGGEEAGYLNTGGCYNPETDTWTDTTTVNAPAGRAYHTAVWSGTELIIWGGRDATRFLGSGGRYVPVKTMFLYQRAVVDWLPCVYRLPVIDECYALALDP